MNSTSLDINVSETLANKTLIVTTILVSFSTRSVEVAVLWWVSASSAVTVAVIATDGTRREVLVNSNGQSPGQSTQKSLLLVSIGEIESIRKEIL